MATTSRSPTGPEERSLPKRGRGSAVIPRRGSLQQERPLMPRQAVFTYLTETYESGKTESEKEFIDALNKSGDFSLRLLIIYIFTIWYTTSLFVHHIILLADNPFTVRCRISALEKCFNFQQVLNISVRDNESAVKYPTFTQYCRYDDRNYTDLIERHGCDYDSIMSDIRKTTFSEMKPCQEYVIINTNLSTLISDVITTPNSIRQYYELFCDNRIWKVVFRLMQEIGRVFFTLLFIVAADLYGRKKYFMFGSSLHLLGCLIMLLPAKWCMAIGILLTGFGKSTGFALYTLVLEKCSTSRVLVMGVLMAVCYPASYVTSFILDYTMDNWMFIHMSNITMLLVLPFGMWYLNESPKWLMFTGNKKEAWEGLMELDSDLQPSDDAFHTAVVNKPSFKNILNFYRLPLFRKRILICLLLFFLHSISCFTEDSAFAIDIHQGTVEFYIIACAFQVFVMILGCFSAVKYGRRRAMFTFYCITTFLHTFIFMENQFLHSRQMLFFLLQGIESLKITVYYIFLLYTSELFPTPYRVTALNICALSRMFGYILQLHLYQVFHPNSKEIRYMPVFISSSVCMLIIYFLPKTANRGLPDTPREALFLPIVQQ